MDKKNFKELNDDELLTVNGGTGELVEVTLDEIDTTPRYEVTIPVDETYKCKSCKQKIKDDMLIVIKRNGKKIKVCPFCKEKPKKSKNN